MSRIIRLFSRYALLLIVAVELLNAADPITKSVQIHQLMATYNEYGLFTGSVLVTDHDHVIFKKAYGLANREWEIANTTDTKFRIGSLTKQFTSMLVMQQVEKGTIRLDAHISDYLPYYREDTGTKVTIHQLLNHTSGIPSYTDDPQFFPKESRDPYTPDEFVRKFCSGDLQFEPGTKFHYDNSGYFILGAILEHVTGKAYEVLLRENLLDPLGMKNTGYDHSSDLLTKRAAGYEHDVDGDKNAAYLDMSLPYAAGSLYSTVEDFYLWDQALYGNKLLRSDLKEKIFTPGLSDFGYGWTIRTVPPEEAGGGGTVIQHAGGINGFNTLEQRLVRDHILIVLFNNTPGGNLAEMANGIRNILFDREPAQPKKSLTLTLRSTIAARGIDAALAQYEKLRRDDPAGYDFAESQLNQLGHMLLGRNRMKDAIAIFKLNVDEYPKSSKVYESLAEAYERDGQKQLAIDNFRKSIEISSNNQLAKDRLKTLEQK